MEVDGDVEANEEIHEVSNRIEEEELVVKEELVSVMAGLLGLLLCEVVGLMEGVSLHAWGVASEFTVEIRESPEEMDRKLSGALPSTKELDGVGLSRDADVVG